MKMFAQAFRPIGSNKVLTLPLPAIQQQADLARVYVVNDAGIIQARLVKLGKIRRDRVEILSGLGAGETVVARAREGLEGAQAQIQTQVVPASP